MMQYHVLTTERCNLSCTYCGGTRIQEDLPLDMEYTISDLKCFIAMDPDPVIGFYGGEPLLAIDRICEIMDAIPAKAFTLQTNGTLLHLLDEEHLQRLHSILVSLDGPREVTDPSRGLGIYDAVMENLKLIRSKGFKGDLIARMAFSDRGDIYRDVMHLLRVEDGIFDHVHWQLDVFWSDLETRGDVSAWLDRYDTGIQRLISEFGSSFGTGNVLGMVPFIPVMNSIMTGRPSTIRCGSGVDSFSIMTSGEVHVCPIAPELLYSKVGDLNSSTPGSIRGSRMVGGPCPDCSIFGLCGGRCLYSNMTMSWGRDWYDRVCSSTRKMVLGLQGLEAQVASLMETGVLSRDAFDYPRINNGCEIIP